MEATREPTSENAAPAQLSPAAAAATATEVSKKRKFDDSTDLNEEDSRRMIEPLTRDQLLDILQHATARHADVLEHVRKFVDRDPMRRKIFVRGLGWDATADTLKAVFSPCGEIDEAVIIMEKTTGKSRGFGFVTFKHMDGALNALKEPSKRIDGRMAFCQPASAGPSPASQPPPDMAMRKIYVGNIPIDLPPDQLLNMFAQYGEIEEGPLGFDKQTGRLRGFAFFVYKSTDGARRALEEPVKFVNRHQIFCKLAVDGPKQQSGATQVQYDIADQSVPPASVRPLVASNLQYNSMPQNGTAASGMPFSQPVNVAPNMNPVVNAPFNANLNTNSVGQNQSFAMASPSPTNTSLPNTAYSQGMSLAIVPTQASSVPLSYGQQSMLSSYSSQGAAYGGQAAAYPGTGTGTMPSATQGSIAPQTAAVQSTAPYGQAVSYPAAGVGGQYGQMAWHATLTPATTQYGQMTQPMATQYGQMSQQMATQYGQMTQQTATQYGQSTPQTMPTQTVSNYAQLPSQATSTQGTGQYVQTTYQNQPLSTAGTWPAHAAASTPSMASYYGT